MLVLTSTLSHCSQGPCSSAVLISQVYNFVIKSLYPLFSLPLSYCDKYHDQDKLGREQLFHLIGYSCILEEAKQELKTRAGSKSHGGMLLTGLVTPACARPFVHNPGPHALEWHCPLVSLIKSISQCRVLQITLGCMELTTEAN